MNVLLKKIFFSQLLNKLRNLSASLELFWPDHLGKSRSPCPEAPPPREPGVNDTEELVQELLTRGVADWLDVEYVFPRVCRVSSNILNDSLSSLYSPPFHDNSENNNIIYCDMWHYVG